MGKYSGDPQDRGSVGGGRAKWVAIVSGVIAVLSALSIPFLPVQQDQAAVSWPQAGVLSSVAAPLTLYAPMGLSADVPCAAFDALATTGGVAVSTIPAQSPDMERYGFVVKVVPDGATAGRVDVVSRNTLLWSASLADVRDKSCALSIKLDNQQATVSVTGTGPTTSSATVPGDLRPQVVGVFSALTGAAPQGLHVNVDVDSRFSSSPTMLKRLVIALCVLATVISMIALHRLDRTDGRSTRRFLPARWWRLRPTDVVVFATLGVWHFIGANTSDDGYILGMARGSIDSGYMSNYYRWFGVIESPFGTPYYDLIAWMSKVSAVSPWVRLPALVASVIIWWVISREVIPRLGVAVRNSRIAVWTAALVFLAFWLPYNNGLRPDSMEALGVLLTWVSVERAIATRRLLPAAAAILIAAVTLTAGPSGLICFAALIAGSRQITQIIVQRASTAGYPAVLLPGVAVGVVVLTLIFADQTLASVLEMPATHSGIEPDRPWFEEYTRYQYLLQVNSDGWLTRRFGVFVMVLGLIISVLTMLRRGGRIPGTATGPSLRILGITFGAMVLMMFTPTKWTHHFGVYAGLAGAVAALTAVAVSPAVMRPLRNRALFAAVVFFLLALTFVGANGYWYVSSWGVPWWDKAPTIAGFGFSTFAVGLTVLALLAAAWFHIRPQDQPRADSAAGRLARTPILAVVAAGMVLFMLLTFVKAAAAQYPSYSLAKSNLTATFSGGCGLADDVLVEPDPNASMLRPISGDIAAGLAGTGSTGFTPNGVAADLTSDEVESTTGRANTVSSDPTELRDAANSAGSEPDTIAGLGINSSTVGLPYGLDPASTPVLGSYSPVEQVPAELITDWYGLPAAENGSRGDILAIAVAGRIHSVDADGTARPGQDLTVEYGQRGPDGAVVSLGTTQPIDIGPAPTWRNLRVPLDRLPGEADVVRIVAADKDLGRDQWLAVTPPRVPQTQTISALVGTETPVLLDWSVGMNFPCQHHLPTRVGVADLPEYRILPDRNGATITTMWQNRDGGGPLGWTQLLLQARQLPAYLNDDWDRDWGSIEQYVPLAPNTHPANISTERVERWGTWTPGHINKTY